MPVTRARKRYGIASKLKGIWHASDRLSIWLCTELYFIYINLIRQHRVRHIGKLAVSKQLSRSSKYAPAVNHTSAEFGRFDITAMDRVWIGGLPELQIKPPELLASNGLPGCVHQVQLDGRPIGLWNFISNAPDNACQPCVEG